MTFSIWFVSLSYLLYYVVFLRDGPTKKVSLPGAYPSSSATVICDRTMQKPHQIQALEARDPGETPKTMRIWIGLIWGMVLLDEDLCWIPIFGHFLNRR